MEARKWNGSPCNITSSCQAHLRVKVLARPSSVSSCHPRESCCSSSPLNSMYNLEEERVYSWRSPKVEESLCQKFPRKESLWVFDLAWVIDPFLKPSLLMGVGSIRTDHEAGDRASFSWGVVLEENTWTKSGLLGRRVGDPNSVRYTPYFIPGT